MQSNPNQHPRFPLDATVRHRGYRGIVGRITHSSETSVYVRWDDGTVGHFDGWQAGNSLRVRVDPWANDPDRTTRNWCPDGR